jgi:hypothetical protein
MKHFYILTTLICFGCLTSNGQRVLFTDNFGTYANGEDLSTNSSGWIHSGVGGFTNKINATYGAPQVEKSNCFAQLTDNGMASAHKVMMLISGETYQFSAYLKSTLTTTDYSTISIVVGGIPVISSGTLAVKNVWEKMSVEYTAASDETAMFVIAKSEGQILNIDKIRISCTSCADKKFVYNFRDSKESWAVKAGCTLGLNKESMIIKATNTTPIAMSGEITQDLSLNTDDYNRAKITFKTPYAMAGAGYGKFFLYDVAGGNSEFATYDFVRDASNTTTFQTAEIVLTSNVDYTGTIARIGVRAPWGISSGGQAFIQRIELYYCTPVTGTDVVSACDEFTWINGVTYTGSNDTSTHILKTVDGCDSTVTLNLTINTVDDSVTVVDEFTLQANASGATYQWIDCSNSDNIAGETDSVFTTQVSGDYAVVITQNGCTDTSDCFTISNTVGIQDIKNLNYTVKLFPNPTTNSITLNLDGISNVNLELFDIQGKLLLTKNRAFNQEQIDVSAFKTGTYFLRILSNEGNQQIKFEVK